MKIFKLEKDNPSEKTLDILRKSLKKGEIVIHPTDTCLGIAANVFCEEAVEKIFKIKKRQRKKPISVLFNSLENTLEYVETNDFSRKILERNLPGPFTFVLKKKTGFPAYFLDEDFLGIRVPDDKISRSLARDFPITTTSANISGEENTYSIKELKITADIAVDCGNLEKISSSTVVKIHEDRVTVLREGSGKPTNPPATSQNQANTKL